MEWVGGLMAQAESAPAVLALPCKITKENQVNILSSA